MTRWLSIAVLVGAALSGACGGDDTGGSSPVDVLGRCVSDNPCECGLVDCDGDGVCEADLTTEAHCGSCDNACSDVTYCGAEATCRCAAGYREVDGDCIAASEAVQPPVITRHPQDLEVEIGASATFTVEATGEELTYTWFQIDSDGNEQQWGSGENELSFDAIDRWNAGRYFARVSNRGGSVDSDLATLTVLPTGLCTVADLEKLREEPNANYRLTCDIDLTDETFAPLEYLSGDLDGNGHTISGWVYDGTDDGGSVGLFRDVYGSIRNLTVEDFDVRGDDGVGALAGHVSGWITDCAARDVRVEAGGDGGALVGVINDGAIVQSQASGNVQASFSAGGLVGSLNGEAVISHCSAQSTVVTGVDGAAGGLVGKHGTGVIANSFAAGSVEGPTVGGLIGVSTSGRVIHSYASTAVDAAATQRGGLFGYLWSSPDVVEGCYWDTQRSGVATDTAGTGLTTTALQTATRFDDWDVASWTFAAGEDPAIAVHALPSIVSTNLRQLDPLGGESLVLTVDNILAGATVFASYVYVCQPGTVEVDADTLRCTTIASSRDSIELRVINPDLHRTAPLVLQYKISERDDLFASGAGSSDDPWVINTPEQFVAIHASARQDTAAQHYALGADIDLDGVLMERFSGEPLGEQFSLDGAGHEIRNYTFSAPTGPYDLELRYEASALFTYIAQGAEIRNLDLRDFNIRGGRAAVLVGTTMGTLSHIRVRDGVVTGGGGASGVTGSLQGTADHITVEGVELFSDFSVAGIAASLSGTISDCTVDITSSAPMMGGVAGYSETSSDNSSSRIERCAVNAIHTGATSYGGVLREVGFGTDVVIVDSYATGSSAADTRGGIVSNLYNREHTTEITRCFSAVDLTSADGGYEGAIVGFVAEGELIATATHWDNDVGPANAIGSPSPPTIDAAGHSTSVMQMEATFTDWDFTSVWSPPSGGYPTLRVSVD